MVEIIFKKNEKEIFYNGIKFTEDSRINRLIFRTKAIAEKEITDILLKNSEHNIKWECNIPKIYN